MNILRTRVVWNNNSLSEIDTAHASDLFLLYAQNNNITSFDLSLNSSLKHFIGSNNNLTSVDIRNNSNYQISSFDVTQNPDLNCIYVDIPNAGYLNNWQTDDSTNFVEDEDACAALTILDKNPLSFKMFPTPAHVYIYITTNHEHSVFKLYTITGKLVLEKELKFGEKNISLSNIDAGIYLVKLTTDAFSLTKKLIIR